MLVYREVASMVTSRMLEGRGVGKEWRMERKWLESLMCEGRDNGAARVIGFVDFREDIEGGGARIRDMKERNVKGGEILCGTKGLKERED